MADTPKRKKTVTARIADDASGIEFDLHGPYDEATGKWTVTETLSFDAASIPEARQVWMALYGVTQIASNRYNRPEIDTPADVRAALVELLDDLRAGTWAPGRTFVASEREPTDLELAIAEVTGQTIQEVMDHVDNDYERGANGEYIKDKAGRRSKVFNKAMLDSIAADPAIRPVLARFIAERAKRVASVKGGTSNLATLFPGGAKPAPSEAAAAN